MGDLKFILGFLAGWITTTEEGKKAATELANGTVKLVKETLLKPNEQSKAN